MIKPTDATLEDAMKLLFEQHNAKVLHNLGIRPEMSKGQKVALLGPMIEQTIQAMSHLADIDPGYLRAVAVMALARHNIADLLAAKVKGFSTSDASGVIDNAARTISIVASLCVSIESMGGPVAASLETAKEKERQDPDPFNLVLKNLALRTGSVHED